MYHEANKLPLQLNIIKLYENRHILTKTGTNAFDNTVDTNMNPQWISDYN